MYRVPSQRRHIAFRRLKIGLATLLALPALGFNGLAVWFRMSDIVGQHDMEFHDLLDLGIAITGIVCSLAFMYGVGRSWPRWALWLGACIILIHPGILWVGYLCYSREY